MAKKNTTKKKMVKKKTVKKKTVKKKTVKKKTVKKKPAKKKAVKKKTVKKAPVKKAVKKGSQPLVPGAWLIPQPLERPSWLATASCPKCDWKPKVSDAWPCSCGHRWNVFATRGECPGCDKRYDGALCLECNVGSNFEEWYGEDAESTATDEPAEPVEMDTPSKMGAVFGRILDPVGFWKMTGKGLAIAGSAIKEGTKSGKMCGICGKELGVLVDKDHIEQVPKQSRGGHEAICGWCFEVIEIEVTCRGCETRWLSQHNRISAPSFHDSALTDYCLMCWVEKYKEIWAGWVRRSMTDNLCITLKSRSEGDELQLVAGSCADIVADDDFVLYLPYPYREDPLTRIKFPKAVYQLQSWEENVHVTIIVPAEQDAVEISEFLIWYIVEYLIQNPSIVDVDASEYFYDEWALEKYWNQDEKEIGIPPKKELREHKQEIKHAEMVARRSKCIHCHMEKPWRAPVCWNCRREQ